MFPSESSIIILLGNPGLLLGATVLRKKSPPFWKEAKAKEYSAFSSVTVIVFSVLKISSLVWLSLKLSLNLPTKLMPGESGSLSSVENESTGSLTKVSTSSSTVEPLDFVSPTVTVSTQLEAVILEGS